ncbi:conserved hypothetical protein [Ricinus communis]|uniref:Uncharacterized protein n=1 Tax=Ricinus communis TaxID=3988 RepID=B9S7G0_RICCO|nr:conserved hypothetical protein [Ricinus communis]
MPCPACWHKDGGDSNCFTVYFFETPPQPPPLRLVAVIHPTPPFPPFYALTPATSTPAAVSFSLSFSTSRIDELPPVVNTVVMKHLSFPPLIPNIGASNKHYMTLDMENSKLPFVDWDE